MNPQRWGSLQLKALCLQSTPPSHSTIWNLDVWGCSGGGSVCQEEPLHLWHSTEIPAHVGMDQHGISRAEAQLLPRMNEWDAELESRSGFVFEGIVVRKVSSVSVSNKAPELRPWRGEGWLFPWNIFWDNLSGDTHTKPGVCPVECTDSQLHRDKIKVTGADEEQTNK